MKIANLIQTCSACPSQWEFKTDGERNVYARYRWGCLSVRVSEKSDGDAVLGVEILRLQLGDDFNGVIDWGAVEKLIKDIHIENTLASIRNAKPREDGS